MRTGRHVIGLAALTAFLDLMGFSVIFPLFPQLLSHYLTLEGPDSTIGSLVGALTALAGQREGAGFLVTVLFGGILGSIYSLLQFVFAPIWGSLSDRIGRRSTLLITLAGTSLAYLGWAFAGTFAVLVAARFVGGMMAGNLATVSAAIADVTKPEERSRGMGMLGAAIGIGFILGPAIGGISTLWQPAVAAAAAASPPALALNPFSGAALAALVLSLINLGLAIWRFPETLTPEQRGRRSGVRTASLVAIFRGAEMPGVQQVNLVSFFFLTAFSAMEFSLVFVTVQRFGYAPRDNAMLFVFVGLVIAVVQGGIVRRLAPAIGDKRVATLGLALLLPGFIGVAIAPTPTVLYLALTLMATGSALATPTLSALVSRYAPAEQQGLALGLFRSVGALSRAVGPIFGGLLYWRFGSTSPYLAGAALLLLPIVLALRLPAPQDAAG